MRSAHLGHRCRVLSLVLTCALFAATCGPMQAVAQGQAGPIATLLATGPYVSVNGQPAANGMPINSGDTVVTGADSSAKLLLSVGGSVQLDANTDPQFLTFVQAGFGCLVRVVLNTGQAYSEGRACISIGPTWIVPRSEFNLLVARGGEVLTVTAGEVAVGSAQWTTVAAGTQASIAGGRIVAQRPVSADELRRITAWRDRYRFAQAAQPPFTPPPGPSPYGYAQPDPGAAIVGGIIGGVVGGAWGSDRGPRRDRTPSTQEGPYQQTHCPAGRRC
jgi:hypothetical protein